MITNKKKFPNLLVLTGKFIAIFSGAAIVLLIFNLYFRGWILIAAALITAVGLTSGIYQQLRKIEDEKKKNIAIGIVTVLIVFVVGVSVVIGAFFVPREQVVEKEDGNKYVAYVTDGLLRTYVNYYEYKNLIVTGPRRISEIWDVGFEPDLSGDEDAAFGGPLERIRYDKYGNETSRER